MAENYRGWDCYYDPPPIPYRGADWTGTHPGYDGIGDPRIVTAGTLKDLYIEIDSWIEVDEAETGKPYTYQAADEGTEDDGLRAL